MELLTLDSNYQPYQLVERYESLIWTERYNRNGDFQLKTTDVNRMLNLLPRESCVTIRESTVPMIVEARFIEKKIGAAPVLTVTGRSFETVLERRVAAKTPSPQLVDGQRVIWTEQTTEPSDAAYLVMRQIIGDEVREIPGGGFLPAQDPILSSKDALPMVDLTLPNDYNPSITPDKHEIKPGNLYSVVLELLNLNRHGLKAVRPELGDNRVRIEIYNGANLATDPDPANNIVFNARFDQFDSSTYLLSQTGSTNIAYVFSKTDSLQVNKNVYDVDNPEPSGLDRRVLYLDVSSEEGADTDEARNTRGLIELYKNNATALFDGQVGQQVAAGYNRDYSLGDIIRLDGEYGLSEYVRVAEFIRSDDSTGSKAYPTFEVVSS